MTATLSTSVKINITEQQKQDCWEFAQIYADTVRNIYAKDRKQEDTKIIVNQAYWAKLAEVAVETAIENTGVKIIDGVDFSIHQRHQKSFDADIKTVNALIHVKSVHFDRKEKSWAFQKSDPVVYEPEQDEVLVFCVTHPTYVEIVGACRATEALEFYYRPRKDELSATKECLYLKNHPKKFKVPEINKILQPLKIVLQSIPENRVGFTDKSRQTMQSYVWKEF
ncbi:MAG: hypothetical protein QNJ47_07945 [Nostocaceae cyanobacterium]|nr:hypothetical protein [Nostocaceae cyanobacterium]